IECGAGVGLVLILRWFWWRINAWSEISAMVTPFIIFPILKSSGILFPYSLFIIVPATTIVCISVTWFTKPTDENVLKSFYKKIHPGGVMWEKISSQMPEIESDSGFFKLFINWLIGVILVYSILFGTGKLILGDYPGFFVYLF